MYIDLLVNITLRYNVLPLKHYAINKHIQELAIMAIFNQEIVGVIYTCSDGNYIKTSSNNAIYALMTLRYPVKPTTRQPLEKS